MAFAAIAATDAGKEISGETIVFPRLSFFSPHVINSLRRSAEPKLRQWLLADNGFEIWSWAKKGPRGRAKTWGGTAGGSHTEEFVGGCRRGRIRANIAGTTSARPSGSGTGAATIKLGPISPEAKSLTLPPGPISLTVLLLTAA